MLRPIRRDPPAQRITAASARTRPSTGALYCAWALGATGAILRPMSTARSTWFRELPLLAGLPEPAIERLARCSERSRIRQRESVWSPGDRGDHVYWVHTGVIRVGAMLDATRDLTLHLHGRQELLGEGPLLLGTPHTTFAEVYEESILVTTPAAELSRLLARNASFALRLLGLVAGRQQHAELRTRQLLGMDSRDRLAQALVDLGARFGVRDSRGLIINLPLTHRALAAIIGTSRETVSLMLRQLRDEGAIAVEGRRVILLRDHPLRRPPGDEC